MRAALTATPETYPELRRCVKEVLFAGRQDIELAWVRTYHEAGRLIHVHLLLHQDRADYGAKVFTRLAADTGVSNRTLHECVHFYRCFPIARPVAQLGWNRCRLICQVDDPEKRAQLAQEAAKAGWTSPQVALRVRAHNAALKLTSGTKSPGAAANGREAETAPQLLVPKRGVAGRYRVVAQSDVADADAAGRLCLDLGFKLYLPLSPAQARQRTLGEIVSVDAEGSVCTVAGGRPSDLFTYGAKIHRVIDGDTLEVVVALPHVVLREKLRLRGLDCPEMVTAEGKAAKRAVEALVFAAKSVTIYTTKSDKYDRYLADVFITTGDGTEIFLNNHLLENGLAERKDAWEFSDWEKIAAR
jgi:endonuclease YncB( thermonuclease family)